MYRLAIPSLLVVGLLLVPSSAQEKKDDKAGPGLKKTLPTTTPATKAGVRAPIPGEVDINFYNGSTVRMIVQSEKLEIATAYGKLSVPVADVRAIEFGLHFPEGMEAKIETAIKNLGATDYRERERAAAALVEAGPHAYPFVLEASKLKDAEVGPRAKDVIKKLQAAHPKKDLKQSVEDRVITKSFTMVGRILTPTMRAKTEYFGDVELTLAKMRTMRAVNAVGMDTELAIDAGKYAVAGQWLDTDYLVDGRTTINITARGFIDNWPQQGGQYTSNANGFQATRGGGGIPLAAGGGIRKVPAITQQHSGILFGRIGEDGDIFIVGERFEAMPETQGKLYLHIGPSQYNSPSVGSYDVKIARKD